MGGWDSRDVSIWDPVNKIRLPLEEDTAGNVCMPVCLQDQHTPTIDALFAQAISNFTLSADTVASGIDAGDLEYTFEATAGHGIAATDEILLLDVAGDWSLQAIVISVATNTITIDRPIDHLFPAATALGRITTSQMNVDGSTTPQIFSIRAGETPSDITRMLITMTDTTSMDDGRFGGGAALTNGLVLRIINSFQKTIFNFKTNGDIARFCYDVRYADKAPAGEYGLNARITFAGQDKHGVTLRIATGDVIQWVVQDDLTGLSAFQIAAEGHITQ
jgi:hypothetical protein